MTEHREKVAATGEDSGLALTILQPWASAIVSGPGVMAPAEPKRVENRGWTPPIKLVGQRFWIHAGKAYESKGHASAKTLWPWIDETDGLDHHGYFLPKGVVLGSARLVGYVVAGISIERHHAADGVAWCGYLPAAWPCMVSSDPWFIGPCGWLLDDVRALREPVPCRGLQKLWRLPDDVLERCRAQEAP